MTKKVLIVTALAGFIRSFLDNDIHILQEMGYEVHCAANANHPGAEGIKNYFKDKGIVFHQIDFTSNKPFSKQTLVSIIEMQKLVDSYEYELVHCHTPIAAVVTRHVCRKKRKEGLKVVYTTHGFYFHKKSSKKSWMIFYPIEKIMSSCTDMIITINQEDFRNAKKMHCKNVRYINGVGIDTKKFMEVKINRNEYRKSIGISPNQIMILAVGELSSRKNHQIIIKALSRLNKPEIVFVICGNAINGLGTTDEIIQLAKQLNVKIVLLGLRKDIPEICHCADIGVMPSTREGLGLSGIEMLASGIPLVSSNVHGIMDYMVDGVTGYVNNPYDEEGFAEAIKKLCDEKCRNRMKINCIRAASSFDKTISNLQMRKIYTEILSKNSI